LAKVRVVEKCGFVPIPHEHRIENHLEVCYQTGSDDEHEPSFTRDEQEPQAKKRESNP
jgi:hypothetical protein